MRIIFSIILFLFSIFYFFYAFNYEFWIGIRPGPAFFPIILGIILIILSASNVLLEVRKANQEEKNSERNLKDVFTVAVFIIIFMIIFQPIGYFLSTVIFLILILFYLNKSKWLQNSLIIIIFMFIIYSLFDYLLNTGLPSGILEGII